MPKIDSNRRRNAAALLLLILATLVLAACGSSSGKTSSTAVAATSRTGAGFATRFAALRECMKKNGVTLPTRTPGQGRPPGGGLLGGGAGTFRLPAGVSRAKYEAAAKKCGFPLHGGFGRRFGGGAAGFDTPAARQSLAKFATCMREQGIDLPAPNTSGTGPVFNTKGLDSTSAKFAAAQAKCSAAIRGLFRARPGTAGGATPGQPGIPAGPPAGEPGAAPPGVG
jgi:hypothetical protein